MSNPSSLTIQRAIRIGVTGHRDLMAENADWLRERLRDVLQCAKNVAMGAESPSGCERLFEDEARVTLISPLARGADQLAAEEALKLGYDLQCPLPFPDRETADAYRQDVSEIADHFDTLLSQASAVLELDGSSRRARSAYESVGRVVLCQADLVLAVWDGCDSEKTGGTSWTVQMALQERIPVVVIPSGPAKGASVTLHFTARDGSSVERPLAGLEQDLAAIIFPYQSASGLSHEGRTDVEAQIAHYKSFCDEKDPGQRWASRLLIGKVWASVWGFSLKAFGRKGWQEPPEVEMPQDRPATERGDVNEARRYFGAHYDWTSRIANYYANLYRSSFLINYVLGALAVTLVLLSTVLHRFDVELVALELLCILIILTVFLIGKSRRWHQRAVDYRVLAEQLRQMKYLHRLALATPFSRPPAHFGDHGDITTTWMNWHFRSVLRSASMPATRFTGPYLSRCRDALLNEWIAPQLTYHCENYEPFKRAHRFCSVLVAVLFAGTAIACSLHLVLPDPQVLDASHAAEHTLAGWLIVLAASLPAWAAVVHGIASQSEFERLAQRSESMERRLDTMRVQFGAMTEATITSSLLGEHASAAAEVMLDEAIDWRFLYRFHDIPTT